MMAEFHMPDSWYEPPDEVAPEYEEHEYQCLIEHDPDNSKCYTRDDLLADKADEAYDRMKDGD